MRLLVSVRSAEEARDALEGGADIIDAKEPTRGALGAVDVETLSAIVNAIGACWPTSAALGEAAGVDSIERDARAAAESGVTFVKIGLGGALNCAHASALMDSACRGARTGLKTAGVIAVAYADRQRARSPSPVQVVEIARRAGASGVLLDTADKHGGGLFSLLSLLEVERWVKRVRDGMMLAAVAGKLHINDLPLASLLGADIAGVRGAACDGGREGRISIARTRALRSALRTPCARGEPCGNSMGSKVECRSASGGGRETARRAAHRGGSLPLSHSPEGPSRSNRH